MKNSQFFFFFFVYSSFLVCIIYSPFKYRNILKLRLQSLQIWAYLEITPTVPLNMRITWNYAYSPFKYGDILKLRIQSLYIWGYLEITHTVSLNMGITWNYAYSPFQNKIFFQLFGKSVWMQFLSLFRALCPWPWHF